MKKPGRSALFTKVRGMLNNLKSLIKVAIFSLNITAATASAQDITVHGIPFSVSDLEARFEMYEIKTVTTWTGDQVLTFSGPRLSDLLGASSIAQNNKIAATAADGYSVEISTTDILKYQPIVATRQSGELIPFEAKGPTRIIWPRSDNAVELTSAKDGYWIWYLSALDAPD